MIGLSIQAYEDLLGHTDHGSSVYSVLAKAIRIPLYEKGVAMESTVMFCDFEQAGMLRDIATQFCPEFTSGIEQWIRLARRY